MMAFLMLPFSVFANSEESNSNDNVESSEGSNDESNDESSDDRKVNVYFFHGDGCPHCAEAEEFFDSIEEEYGSLFNLVAYETWYDEKNAKMLDKIAEARGENITGVPYILIGNKSWPGYGADSSDGIIEQIRKEYETPVSDRYDIMELVDFDDVGEETEKNYSSDIMTLAIILVVVAGIVTGVVVARKKTA